MKLISSISIADEKLQEFKKLCPELEIMQVKTFTEPDNQAEVLLTYGWDVKKETLDLFPNLRWIQSMSAGVDMLPLETIAEKKIMLSNVQGAHKIQMSEHVIWSMLMLLRQGATFVHQQDKKSFSAKPKVDEMKGKTVCIVGAGTIGREIALKCSVFGMKVLGISVRANRIKHLRKHIKLKIWIRLLAKAILLS
jgi:phosphoglycerate dehydrogenase-like enzyme